jgi:hypothetical protein
VDLHCALEEHATFKNKTPVNDSYAFPILDHNVEGVPWKSILVLRAEHPERFVLA